MDKNSQVLFPEEDLIDMKFMEMIKYATINIDDTVDADKAVREYSFLIKKEKELWAKNDKAIANLLAQATMLQEQINGAKNEISSKIENYFMHTELHFEDTADYDTSVATIDLEHGKIVFIQKRKLDFKIKFNKETRKEEQL